MQISLDSIVSTRRDIFATEVDSEVVVFDPLAGNYYGSGQVGQRIWMLLSEKSSVASICKKLLDEFEVDQQTCQDEVISFLSDLENRGLLILE